MKKYKVSGYAVQHTPIITMPFKAKNKKEAVRMVEEGEIDWDCDQYMLEQQSNLQDLEAEELKNE